MKDLIFWSGVITILFVAFIILKPSPWEKDLKDIK
jgi:hypothetical protein